MSADLFAKHFRKVRNFPYYYFANCYFLRHRKNKVINKDQDFMFPLFEKVKVIIRKDFDLYQRFSNDLMSVAVF